MALTGLMNWREFLYYDFLRLILIISYNFTDNWKVILSLIFGIGVKGLTDKNFLLRLFHSVLIVSYNFRDD